MSSQQHDEINLDRDEEQLDRGLFIELIEQHLSILRLAIQIHVLPISSPSTQLYIVAIDAHDLSPVFRLQEHFNQLEHFEGRAKYQHLVVHIYALRKQGQ